MDFVVEEDLKAHLTCWYIQKYIKENPHPHYLEHILHWEPEMGKISILIGWLGIFWDSLICLTGLETPQKKDLIFFVRLRVSIWKYCFLMTDKSVDFEVG